LGGINIPQGADFFKKDILPYTAQMSLQNTKGFWPVTVAIGGNFFVTLIKLFAAVTSGSSSMLSEAVHSLADTINQVLLLIGLKRSTKKPMNPLNTDTAMNASFGLLSLLVAFSLLALESLLMEE